MFYILGVGFRAEKCPFNGRLFIVSDCAGRTLVTWVDGLFPTEFPFLSRRVVVVAREEEGDEEPSSSSSERRGHSLANSRYHSPFLANWCSTAQEYQLAALLEKFQSIWDRHTITMMNPNLSLEWQWPCVSSTL